MFHINEYYSMVHQMDASTIIDKKIYFTLQYACI